MLGTRKVGTPSGYVQTDACQTGGNPQTRRRGSATRYPNRNGSLYPASPHASDDTDLRSAVFAEQFGFRPRKRAHDAVKQAQAYIQDGCRWVVDMDLEKFFDRVNHAILMSRMARKVSDKRVLKLIRAYLNAGVMVDGMMQETLEGTPQGGPLSPLLANILLDDLDKELTERGLKSVRYAGDCAPRMHGA